MALIITALVFNNAYAFRVSTVTVGADPVDLAFNPSNNEIYVSNAISSTISLISGTNVVGTVKVNLIPGELIFNPSNNDIYVTTSVPDTITVISGTTIVGTITTSQFPTGLIFNPFNNDVYVSNDGSDTVSVISGTNVIATTSVGSFPTWFGYNPSNKDVYVSNEQSSTVSVISGTTTIGAVKTGSGPSTFAYNPSNKYMYVVTGGSDSVSAILNTSVVGSIPAGIEPNAIAFNPSNNDIYVTSYGSNTVTVISGKSVVGTVSVGSHPSRIAFDPYNNDIYVVNSGSNTVSVISDTNLVGTVPVGSAPDGIAFNPSNNDMYVANDDCNSSCNSFTKSTVSVIADGIPSPTQTVVSPNPTNVGLESSTIFAGKVIDTNATVTIPNGTLTWTDGGAGGTFSINNLINDTCVLSSTSPSASSCRVTYKPPSTASVGTAITINATYFGDGIHSMSSAISKLTVERASMTAISPSTATMSHGTKQIYNATVTDTSLGTKSAPTGKISWSASKPGGSFSAGICTLVPITKSQSRCSVTYTASSIAGSLIITSLYDGDGTHATSIAKSTLTVT